MVGLGPGASLHLPLYVSEVKRVVKYQYNCFAETGDLTCLKSR
jgi:hypothetical protein